MRDRFGTPDGTPAVWSWTVDLNPVVSPVIPAADGDGDGVPDASDNCPSTVNASQADDDADGVGDGCEVAAPGDLPPITGERVVVKVLSGDVFIKLPATRSLKQALSGFVDSPDGSRHISFSYIQNGPNADAAAAPIWDALGRALTAYPTAPPVDQLAPLPPAPPS